VTHVGSSAGPRQPDLSAGLLRAVGAAVLGAGIWIGVAGPLGARAGLLAVALFVGWLVGSAARSGAGARGPAVGGVAVAGGLLTWVLALVGVYVYSLAVIPDLPGGATAGADLVARMRETPITEFYAPQFGLLDVFQGVVLLVAAWWTAR
jgi:hypothetical protein